MLSCMYVRGIGFGAHLLLLLLGGRGLVGESKNRLVVLIARQRVLLVLDLRSELLLEDLLANLDLHLELVNRRCGLLVDRLC